MKIRNLCKSYDGWPVLRNVSFSMEDRGITALCAPSGAGKTTLLRILLGLEVPDSGELLGTDVRWSAVFQEDRLLEGLDAMGNLRFVLGASFDEATAATQLAALGLADAGTGPVRVWSGGMKRRLALARALLAESEALALDEPFTGLDDDSRRPAMEAVACAAETKPVLLVTHDAAALEALKPRIIPLPGRDLPDFLNIRKGIRQCAEPIKGTVQPQAVPFLYHPAF